MNKFVHPYFAFIEEIHADNLTHDNVMFSTLVKSISDANANIVLITRGSGYQISNTLLHPSLKKVVLEVLHPQSRESIRNFFPQHFQSKNTSTESAKILAGRAYVRAQELRNSPSLSVGISCVASSKLDRAYISSWAISGVQTYELHLSQTQDRENRDVLVNQILYNTIVKAVGKDDSHLTPLSLSTNDTLKSHYVSFSDAASALNNALIDFVHLSPIGHIFGSTKDKAPAFRFVVAGSFNPLHVGHLQLLEEAQKHVGNVPGSDAFELSAFNVDKPPLPVPTILERINQFCGKHSVVATNAPTFIQKARLFPGATFVVGYDTAIRIVNKKYYQDSEENTAKALEEIKNLGCKFVVAGRLMNGVFHSPGHLSGVPEPYRDLFTPLESFRVDISSTEIREKRNKTNV